MAKGKDKKASESGGEAGAFAFTGLDRVLHEKARLGILTALITRPDGVLFTELKELCSLTDGNLARHLQVLSESNLIAVYKGQEDGRSQTLVRLSKRGRSQFLAYLGELERVIDSARGGEAPDLDAPGDWATA